MAPGGYISTAEDHWSSPWPSSGGALIYQAHLKGYYSGSNVAYFYVWAWTGSSWVRAYSGGYGNGGSWDFWIGLPSNTTQIKTEYYIYPGYVYAGTYFDVPEVQMNLTPTTQTISVSGASVSAGWNAYYGLSGTWTVAPSGYNLTSFYVTGTPPAGGYINYYYVLNGGWYYLAQFNGPYGQWLTVPSSGVTQVAYYLYTGYSPQGQVQAVTQATITGPPYQPVTLTLPFNSTIPRYQQTISWYAPGNPTGTSFELWRKTFTPSGSVLKDERIYSGTSTQFSTTDQQAGTYYTYRVRAFYNNAFSNCTPEVPYATPPAPMSVTAGPASLGVTWSAVYPNMTYKVFYLPKNGSWTQAGTTTSTSYTISGLTPATSYLISLQVALPAGGTNWGSAYSQYVTPLAAPPGPITFPSASQTSLTATWGANGNVGIGYEAWYKPTSTRGFLSNGTFDVVHMTHVGVATTSNSVSTYLGGGWYGSTNLNTATIGPAKEGGNTFLRLTSDGSGGWAAATAPWSVKAGKWYRVTVSARTSSTTPLNIPDYAFYSWSDGNTRPQLTWTGLTAADGWKVGYSIFQAAQDSGGATFLYGNYGAAGTTLDYDSVIVEQFDSQPPDAPGSAVETVIPGGGIVARVFDATSLFNAQGNATSHDQMLAFFDQSKVVYNTTVTMPNVDWTTAPTSLTERFSVEHQAYIYAPVSGTYLFATDSDDASEIEVDGQTVVGWYGGHGLSNDWSHNGSIALSAGWHKFIYRMEQGLGGLAARAAWQKPGDSSFSVIPRDAFGGLYLAGGPVTMSGLSAGTSYDIMVQAIDSQGFASLYTAATRRTVPVAPTPSGDSGALDWSNTAGRGWASLSWQPVLGATGYKVWVCDGYQYRAFDVGGALSWDSRTAKIYPSESYLSGLANDSLTADPFNHSGTGLDLRDTPITLYLRTAGTNYNTSNNYWFRLSAYNESGDSGTSSVAYTPTLPNRTDTTSPTGTVLINNDQMVAGGPSVTLNLSATDPAVTNYTADTSDDASGVAKMRFSNDGTTWSSWAPYSATYPWKIDTNNFGKKTVYAQFQDAAGNVSATASDDVYYYLVDAQAPNVTLTINNGADVTSSPQVQLQIDAKDDLTPATDLQMRFSADFSTWTPWVSYTPYKTWTFPSGDGQKTLFVQVHDASGNIGTAYARINLVTTAGSVLQSSGVFWSDSGTGGTAYPSGQAVQARFITGSQVTLRLNAPGASQVRWGFDNVRWLPPEPAADKVMSLPDWEGYKTVYAKLSTGTTYSVTFVLDRTGPTVDARWLGDATVTNAGTAVILLTATDNFTRQQDLQYSIDGGATWHPYAAQVTVTFSGTGYKTETIMVRDQAANVAVRTIGIFN
ncbi:MAG: fibronectin type III domain-containing protein [Bacillota bacterium]